MKLFLLSQLMRLCDATCSALHRCQRGVIRLREWAWIKATMENLRSCNTRALRR